MARIGPLPVEGTVHVEPHAIEQARARFPDDYADKDDVAVGRAIAAEVRDAMTGGRVFDKRPRGFFVTGATKHGTGGGRMRVGQRFVQHPAGEKGWVVSLASRIVGDVDVVTTLRRLP